MLDFAQYIRFNEHGKTTKSTLLIGTLKSTIVDVAKTSRENFRRDPTQDANSKIFSSIATVILEYKDRYPNTRNYTCLPLRVSNYY